MREILFRGKRKDNGEWVYGWLGHLHCHNPRAKTIDSVYFTKITEDHDSTMNIIVDYETIGQYTGLEANGKKIFEGDLLESRFSENKEDWKIWQVSFEDGSFVFDSVRKSIKSRRKFKHEQNLLCIDEIKFYGLVKIGNIHDNSELLKGGGKG